MTLGIEGKKAIVTGAGGAIGGKIAELLAEEEAEVALWDIRDEQIVELAKTIGDGSAFPVKCDAMDPESVRAAMDITVARTGTLDILVNCAGGSRKETTTSESLSFFDMVPEEMQKTIGLNYFASVIPSQQAARVFAEKGQGTILNISSISGVLPVTRGVSYSDGKAAINSFTRWLAVHLAQNYSPKIRVNAVAPGFLLTEQNRFLLMDPETGEPTPRGQTVVSQVPVARYGTPEEIAAAAVFLASDRASFITGAVLIADGGLTAFLGV